jgi:type VI protein secretion system component Hcp
MSHHLRLLRWPLIAVAIAVAVALVAVTRSGPAEGVAGVVPGTVTYTGLDGTTASDTVNLTSFDWKATAPAPTPTGGGVGKATFADPQVVQSVSTLSPVIMDALARGRSLPTITVVLNRPSTGTTLQSWTFTQATLTLDQQHKTSGAVETVAFAFRKVTQTIFAGNGTTVVATRCFDASLNAGC